MRETLHTLRCAAAAIRRLDPKNASDAEALTHLGEIIDRHGESIARTIKMASYIEQAINAKSDAEQAHASGGAIASFVALAKSTGVSQLSKAEVVMRASDALGFEQPDVFLHKPGSLEDQQETRELSSTPDGRAFVLEIMAQHLNMLPIGVAAHGAIQSQIGLMNLAARGRSIWPEPVRQERIKTNSGRQHAWEALLAFRGGMAKQIAEHHGIKLSDADALHLALANFMEKSGVEPPDYVSIPSLLQTLQKERGGLPKLFRYGARRMAVILRKDPMLLDDMRQAIEKIR